jgi:hypothetical protein
MSQIVLQKIKFVNNYNYVVPKETIFYFIAVEPLNSLDLTFSKSFERPIDFSVLPMMF